MSDMKAELASLKIDRNPAPKASGSGTKWLVWLVVLVVVALGGVLAFDKIKERVLKPQITTTEVSLLSPAQADIKLVASGYVVPQRKALVAAKQVGRIKEMLVTEGLEVKAGQLLATIESDDLQAALSEARALLATADARVIGAKASQKDARTERDRQKQLRATETVGQAALDQAEARLSVAEANVAAAEAEAYSARTRIQRAELAVANAKVLAPFSGRVVRKLVEVGETPALATSGGSATGSQGVVELVDFTSLVVEADVSEGKVSQVLVGNPAEITLDAYQGKRFAGEVTELRPTVDRQKATVLVRVKFTDTVEGVLPQMAARVSFLSKALDKQKMQEPAKLVVSESAITQRGGAPHVFVFRDGRVRMQSVTLGEKLGSLVELKQGPAAGTKVVNNPPSQLDDGVEVKEQGK